MEWTHTSLRLTTELAALRLSTGLKEAADAGAGPFQILMNETAPQRRWLLEAETAHPFLRRALTIAETLQAFGPSQSGLVPLGQSQIAKPTGDQAGAPDGFAEYAARLDRAYPLTASPESWLSAAERDGAAGLRRRLDAGSGAAGEAERERLASSYFETRLRPLLTAHLVALALRAEADAELGSREAWLRLRTWRDRQREAKGLTRLCGTWQWTIHNHQNHQDHKMMMVFDPPAPPSTAQQTTAAQSMKPAKIVILGEGVYLRWESPGGYQEDSLLFTGEGQRLEGSFVNSSGAWGSITGKRVAACQK